MLKTEVATFMQPKPVEPKHKMDKPNDKTTMDKPDDKTA